MTTKLLEILRHLKSHPEAYYFVEPVDPIKLNLPTYFQVIQRPMDYKTVLGKLQQEAYQNEDEFAADIDLVFTNAMAYNVEATHPVHAGAKKMKKIFDEKIGELRASSCELCELCKSKRGE